MRTRCSLTLQLIPDMKNDIKIKPHCRLYKVRSKVAFLKAHIWRQSFISKATHKTASEISSWRQFKRYWKSHRSLILVNTSVVDKCRLLHLPRKRVERQWNEMQRFNSGLITRWEKRRLQWTRKQSVTRENKQGFPCHGIGINPVLLRCVSIIHCSLIKQKTWMDNFLIQISNGRLKIMDDVPVNWHGLNTPPPSGFPNIMTFNLSHGRTNLQLDPFNLNSVIPNRYFHLKTISLGISLHLLSAVSNYFSFLLRFRKSGYSTVLVKKKTDLTDLGSASLLRTSRRFLSVAFIKLITHRSKRLSHVPFTVY